jgi:hypothetical protein
MPLAPAKINKTKLEKNVPCSVDETENFRLGIEEKNDLFGFIM